MLKELAFLTYVTATSMSPWLNSKYLIINTFNNISSLTISRLNNGIIKMIIETIFFLKLVSTNIKE